MATIYRQASMADLDFLVQSRLDFVGAEVTGPDYELILKSTRHYFETALRENQCDVILAEKNDAVIGTGVIFYYASVPSVYNPWGKNAYITSMFVAENHRRKGIATAILDKLVDIARQKGYYRIFLQASDMGKPLYENYGFTEGMANMLLNLEEE
jgi:Predicted acetyltransferase